MPADGKKPSPTANPLLVMLLIGVVGMGWLWMRERQYEAMSKRREVSSGYQLLLQQQQQAQSRQLAWYAATADRRAYGDSRVNVRLASDPAAWPRIEQDYDRRKGELARLLGPDFARIPADLTVYEKLAVLEVIDFPYCGSDRKASYLRFILGLTGIPRRPCMHLYFPFRP